MEEAVETVEAGHLLHISRPLTAAAAISHCRGPELSDLQASGSLGSSQKSPSGWRLSSRVWRRYLLPIIEAREALGPAPPPPCGPLVDGQRRPPRHLKHLFPGYYLLLTTRQAIISQRLPNCVAPLLPSLLISLPRDLTYSLGLTRVGCVRATTATTSPVAPTRNPTETSLSAAKAHPASALLNSVIQPHNHPRLALPRSSPLRHYLQLGRPFFLTLLLPPDPPR